MDGGVEDQTREFSTSAPDGGADARARFETAWRSGERPRIEDSLAETAVGPVTDSVLSRLLALEVSLRLEAGESPSRAEYLARFPDARGLVEAVFDDPTATGDDVAAELPSTFRSAATDETQRTTESESTAPDDETAAAGGAARDGAPNAGSVGGWSASRFEVLSFHDAGTLGKVFIARDRELNRDVALKRIQERFARHPSRRARFILEGMVTGALEHPGIVPVYSLGVREDGEPFYAMRFIQGPSLREKLKQLHAAADAPPLAPGEERPTLPRLLRHFVQACHAVAYAHDRGVIHRDLKPEHVLLGPFGETLVVDWGLAIPTPAADGRAGSAFETLAGDASPERDGVVVGTPSYMSPEQAMGFQSALDRRSDVYALGAILYALLTGRAPIAGGTFETVLAKVRRGEFPRPRAASAAVPAALEAVCLKAMALDRDDRYAAAGDLARDVERWLDDEPTVAYDEPLAVRVGRWGRRHRATVAAAGVALVCATIGMTALYLNATAANAEIRRQRDRAETAALQREANFRASLEAVNGYLRRIGMEDLPLGPGTTALRGDIAAVTARLLDTLRRQKPEDPEVRYMAGHAYREHANILRLLGRDADDSYRAAVELLRAAAAARPGEPKYRDTLSETLKDAAGPFLLANRPAAAAPFLAEAMDLAARLRRERPDEPKYARSEARVAASLADNLLLTGLFADARAQAERALALMRPLADGDAPGPTDRLEVVVYLCALGEALIGEEKPADAAPVLDEAIRRAAVGLAGSPGFTDLRFLTAYARIPRTRALSSLGRDDEAKTAIDAAAADLDALAAEYPDVVHYRGKLAEALLVRARLGADADARRDLDRARALVAGLLRTDPENLVHVGLLGRIEGRLALAVVGTDPEEARRRLTRAIASQRRCLEANPESPPDLKALKEWEAALAALPSAAE